MFDLLLLVIFGFIVYSVFKGFSNFSQKKGHTSNHYMRMRIFFQVLAVIVVFIVFTS